MTSPARLPYDQRGHNGQVQGPHEYSPSSEFGEFHSAAPHDASSMVGTSSHDLLSSSPSARMSKQKSLDDDDLLISFDDMEDQQTSASSFSLHQGLEYSTDEPIGSGSLSVDTRHHHSSFTTPPQSSLLELSPTRSRHGFPSHFSGPGSPPRLTDAGADIVFHPPPLVRGKDDAASEFRRIRRMSDEWTASGKHAHPSISRSPPHSRASLANAFTTSRLATRWKRSVLGPAHPGEQEPPSKTAVPIDISHKTPFASVDQVAGSYAAPDGAPGFQPESSTQYASDDEWSGTRLDGRREITAPVLDVGQAKEVCFVLWCRTPAYVYPNYQLRPVLPPRQRISDSWRLLCESHSMEQTMCG